jgi:hypothetical protein
MTKQSDALDLVSTHEIAEMLDVTRQRAFMVSQKKGFPDPVAELGADGTIRIWRRSDVVAWADKDGREVVKAVRAMAKPR